MHQPKRSRTIEEAQLLLPLRRVAREGAIESTELPALEPLAQVIDRLTRADDPTRSVETILALLRRDGELTAGVRRYFARMSQAARTTAALSDLGLLPAHGLAAELRERVVSKVLPSYRPPHDLIEMLGELFSSRRTVEWLGGVEDARLIELARAIVPDETTPGGDAARAHLALGTFRAIDLLAHRLAAAGEDPDLHFFAPETIDHESPFLAQAEEIVHVTSVLRARAWGQPIEDEPPDLAHARVLLAQCRDHVDGLIRGVPRTGATVRLTYELARMQDLLERIFLLLDAISLDAERAWTARITLVRQMVRARNEREHIGPLLARGVNLVATEIVSHAGRTGEHYITRTPADYARMWGAAAGAGAIIALMAGIKVGLAALHAPAILEAALFSANYAIGFVVVQLLGLTIATKQPAMTAAALASAVDPSRPRETGPLVDTIICLVRSQIAAIGGNVLIALPAALLLTWLFALATGAPIADVAKAQHLVHDLDPLESGAWPHAAITGVWLALSGVAAGYASNSVIARHVPMRIARSAPLRRWLGERRVERLAAWSGGGMGAFAGSVVLGVLLGSTGTIGGMLGLPIDIRHVSFSSANLGLAIGTLGVGKVHMGESLAGIAGIGALNLAVSFGVSLGLALRARGRRLNELPKLAHDLARAVFVDLPAWILPVGRTAQAEPRTEGRTSAASIP